MILSRRVAHRRAAVALAVAVPGLLAAALGLRPELPPRASPAPGLLAEAGFGPDRPAGARPPILLEGSRASYEIQVLSVGGDGDLELALRPGEPLLAPELLVYWIADPEAEALPSSGAVLLGSVAGTSRRRLRLPGASRGGGQLALYSLSQGRLVDRFALPDGLRQEAK